MPVILAVDRQPLRPLFIASPIVQHRQHSAAAKGRGVDRRVTAGDHHLLQGLTIVEGIRPHRFHTGGKYHALQRIAAAEGIFPNGLQAAGQAQVGKPITICEGIAADADNALRDRHPGQIKIAPEQVLPDPGQPRGQRHLPQATLVEGIVADLGHAVRNGNAMETGAVVKRAVLNNRYAVRHGIAAHLLTGAENKMAHVLAEQHIVHAAVVLVPLSNTQRKRRTAREDLRPDPANTGGNRDFRQGKAMTKGTLSQLPQSLAQRNAAQGFAAVEGFPSDHLDAVSNGDLLQIFQRLERFASNGGDAISDHHTPDVGGVFTPRSRLLIGIAAHLAAAADGQGTLVQRPCWRLRYRFTGVIENPGNISGRPCRAAQADQHCQAEAPCQESFHHALPHTLYCIWILL